MPTGIREDWVRGKHTYTLIFWSRGFAKSIEISGQSDQQMLSKLDQTLGRPSQDVLQEYNRRRLERAPPLPQAVKGELRYVKQDEKAADQDLRPPMLAGTLTDWKYTPMFTIEDFVMLMDENYKGPLEYLIENQQLGS